MADNPAENSFIVISGHNPQTGKRERISRVRSHITKRYFDKLHHHAEKQERSVSITGTRRCQKRRNPSQPVMCQELRFATPIPDISLQNPASFAAETTRRMHKFFNVYLLGQVESNPFLLNVLSWSLTDPHFTSAKLLNASGWDDVLESGELRPWTTQQRFITMRLLNDSLKHDAGARGSLPTVAAVQSLLGFELLIGNNENIDRLMTFYQGLIKEFARPNNEAWNTLICAHFLLSRADRLRRTSSNARPPYGSFSNSQSDEPDSDLRLRANYQFALPVDLTLFTLNHTSMNKDQYIHVLLCDLYLLLAPNVDWHNPLYPPTYEYVVGLHNQLLPYILDQDLSSMHSSTSAPTYTSSGIDNQFYGPLRQSLFILTSCLLTNPCEGEPQSLSSLVSKLRSMLSLVHNHIAWTPFPGALVWCYAIGLRFADPQLDQKWFLMQFLRVSHSCTMKKWEETAKSMEVVTYGLERIRPMYLEAEEES